MDDTQTGLGERELEQVRALVDAASAAQTDVEGLMALHTEDTVVVNIGGRRVLGRAALTDAMRAALATPLAGVRTSVDLVDARLVAPDVVLASCVKTVHDERPGADGDLPATGTMSYVLRRGAEGWRIALAQTTPVPTG